MGHMIFMTIFSLLATVGMVLVIMWGMSTADPKGKGFGQDNSEHIHSREIYLEQLCLIDADGKPVTRKPSFVRDKPVGDRSIKHGIRIPTWLDASKWRQVVQLMKGLVGKKLARLIGRGTNLSDLGTAKDRDWWVRIPRSWKSKFFWVL